MSDDLNNTVSKLLASREDRERAEAVVIENIKEYKRSLNDVAATPSGELFLKTLIKVFGIHNPKGNLDAVSLIRANAKSDIYLEFIRPHLEIELRQKIES